MAISNPIRTADGVSASVIMIDIAYMFVARALQGNAHSKSAISNPVRKKKQWTNRLEEGKECL